MSEQQPKQRPYRLFELDAVTYLGYWGEYDTGLRLPLLSEDAEPGQSRIPDGFFKTTDWAHNQTLTGNVINNRPGTKKFDVLDYLKRIAYKAQFSPEDPIHYAGQSQQSMYSIMLGESHVLNKFIKNREAVEYEALQNEEDLVPFAVNLIQRDDFAQFCTSMLGGLRLHFDTLADIGRKTIEAEQGNLVYSQDEQEGDRFYLESIDDQLIHLDYWGFGGFDDAGNFVDEVIEHARSQAYQDYLEATYNLPLYDMSLEAEIIKGKLQDKEQISDTERQIVQEYGRLLWERDRLPLAVSQAAVFNHLYPAGHKDRTRVLAHLGIPEDFPDFDLLRIDAIINQDLYPQILANFGDLNSSTPYMRAIYKLD